MKFFEFEKLNNMVGFLWDMAVPSGKDFSNLKTCDIINSGRSSEPVITDSISLALGKIEVS